jgi:transcriptional regulator with XRE-family HTH domain
MWLDKLKELKSASGMTSKKIAEGTNLPLPTIVRIFSGETNDPRVDTVRRIVAFLGGSLDDVFAESGAVIGDQKLSALSAELECALSELSSARAEVSVLTASNTALTAEIELLRLKVAHKDEIIAHKEKIISLYARQDKYLYPES